MKFYKDSTTGKWMLGTREGIPAGTCLYNYDSATELIVIEYASDRTIFARLPYSEFLKENGTAYASKAEFDLATADFFVKTAGGISSGIEVIDALGYTPANKINVDALEIQVNSLVSGIPESVNKSDVVDGSLYQPTLKNFDTTETISSIINVDLLNIGIKNYMHTAKNGSNNVELYWWFRKSDSSPKNVIANLFETYKDKYCKIRYYIYTKSGVMPSTPTANRLGISLVSSTGTSKLVGSDSSNGNYVLTKISDNLYKAEKTFLISYTGTLNYIFGATVWVAGIVPGDFVDGDFGVTGLAMKFADNQAILNSKSLVNDWMVVPSKEDITTVANEAIAKAKIPEVFNNLAVNSSMISEFLRKYEMKEVDTYNQLTITMVGDSIFGRQDSSSFNPAAPQIAITPDCNGGVGNGYETGHFPPNMWEQLVGYKVLTMLQYPHADVKYYNHVANEVTKIGTWTNAYPVGADCLRLARTAETNASIQLAFTCASFAKFIYSTYGGNGATRQVKLTVSTDGGATFVKIADAGLTCSMTLDANSQKYLPAQNYKWGNIIIAGLTPATSYIFKVQKVDASNTLDVWGFETWSKPRINVVITAEGGNTASSQLTRWDRFYSVMYNPALIIYELPYINDLGGGVITNFKGVATTSTTPSGSPTTNDFWYASVSGTYTNFSGVVAVAGDYIEYNGSTWIIGNTSLTTTLANYSTKNNDVFKRIATIGCPVLTIIPHNVTGWKDSRPFTFNNGLTILRNLVAKYGFASIDLNYYSMNYGHSTDMVVGDETHLNDVGVEVYRYLLSKLFAIPYSDRVVQISTPVRYTKLVGTGTGASTVTFGYEFASTPTIRIYNNSTIAITAVTQSSFTVTGTGAFDYEAFIQ